MKSALRLVPLAVLQQVSAFQKVYGTTYLMEIRIVSSVGCLPGGTASDHNVITLYQDVKVEMPSRVTGSQRAFGVMRGRAVEIIPLIPHQIGPVETGHRLGVRRGL